MSTLTSGFDFQHGVSYWCSIAIATKCFHELEPGAGTIAIPVFICLSLCLSQVEVLSKRLNELNWFLAGSSLRPNPTLRCKEIHVYTITVLCPKLWTWKISLQHVDRRNGLSTQFDEDGRSEHDKVDRRRSAKLTISATVDC